MAQGPLGIVEVVGRKRAIETVEDVLVVMAEAAQVVGHYFELAGVLGKVGQTVFSVVGPIAVGEILTG